MHWQFGEMEFGEMKRNTSNWSNFGMLLLARFDSVSWAFLFCIAVIYVGWSLVGISHISTPTCEVDACYPVCKSVVNLYSAWSTNMIPLMQSMWCIVHCCKGSNGLQCFNSWMLRCILGLTLMDRKRNYDIRRILRVACMTDKVREARLRWYGHIQRQEDGDCVKQIFSFTAFSFSTLILLVGVFWPVKTVSHITYTVLASSTTWRTCSSTWRMQRIELNGEEEPVWLTPRLRDPQPEGERECFNSWHW